MCGIVGAIDLKNERSITLDQIKRMTTAIAHRGPDGDGFYAAGGESPTAMALGMRRLSIIDLDGGDQPIGNEDGAIQIVFNGEIYNYLELGAELRARGHEFKTVSDTETIVHLYEEYDLDLFQHLRGMYAFALWDARRQRLLLATDHIGIKPLYVCQAGTQLVFGSEVKALFAFGNTVPRAMNADLLDIYLTAGFMVGSDTLFQGIKRLSPGTALVIEKGNVRELRHWLPNYAEALPHMDTAAYVDQVRATIEEAVRLHLRSDVPLGLFLSGGIDSASLLALMAKFEPGRINTFTVGYGDGAHPDNELAAARDTAKLFGSDHHELTLTAGDWWDHMLHYITAHEEPNANPSAVSLLALSKLTAQSVKVVLNGIGSDELFGGYRWHRHLPQAIRRAAVLHTLLPLPLRRFSRSLLTRAETLYPRLSRYRVVGAIPNLLPPLYHGLDALPIHLRRSMTYDGQVFSDRLRTKLLCTASSAVDRVFAEMLARAPDSQADNLIHFLVMNYWLPGNGLLSADKVSMAYSLEARVPFFDRCLLTLVMAMPSALRGKDNKFLLRSAMQPFLSPAIANRPKKPFGTPIRAWFEGPLRARLQEVLYDPVASQRPYFEPRAYKQLLDGHFSGRTSQPEMIWRLVNLELWQRRFIDTPDSPHPPTPSPSWRGGVQNTANLTPPLPEGEGAGG